VSDGWSESARVLRQLADVVDAMARTTTAVAQMARAHADCESVLEALSVARGHLSSAEIALHDHARAFERVIDDGDREDRDRE